MKKYLMSFVIVLVLIFSCYYFYALKKQENVCVLFREVELLQSPKMRKFLLNKLWRDKAVGKLDKVCIHVQTLDNVEYEKQLNLKLVEEAHEVIAAIGNKNELASEIGDVLEVLECIARFHDINWNDVLAKKQAKVDDRGSYVERQFVTIAECQPDSWLLSYYMKDPERNVEIFD